MLHEFIHDVNDSTVPLLIIGTLQSAAVVVSYDVQPLFARLRGDVIVARSEFEAVATTTRVLRLHSLSEIQIWVT
jgi:PHD/YefM family antitoxin component YafN of YafNO toxin-antitoxin module